MSRKAAQAMANAHLDPADQIRITDAVRKAANDSVFADEIRDLLPELERDGQIKSLAEMLREAISNRKEDA